MPLDHQSAALLAARREANLPATMALTIEELRATREAWRKRASVPPAAVHTVADHDISVAGGSIAVRIYRPTASSLHPAVLYFHGGGWVLGDLEHSDALCRALCIATGAVVANVNYRLAPEHKYPVAAEDCYAALRFVAQNAARLGIDAGRVAVAGSSAGGNLAAATALMSRDRGGPEIRAQLLIYPVLDAACAFPSYESFTEGYIISAEEMLWYWRQYLSDPNAANDAYACPLRAADLSRLPSTLVITAEYDPVRDDGEVYADQLQAFGVSARLSRYPGTLHGFFAMPRVLEKADAALAEAAAFLRSELQGPVP
jgi:acetyl esterase